MKNKNSFGRNDFKTAKQTPSDFQTKNNTTNNAKHRCNCGHMMSPNADRCPSCNTLNRSFIKSITNPLFQCRICKTTLVKREHYYIDSASYIRDGNTTAFDYRGHSECSNCGEPKPYPIYKRILDIFNLMKVGVVVGVVYFIYQNF